MAQALNDLEIILDEYTMLGGIDLCLAKGYRDENGNNATTWSFFTSSGGLFRAMLYWVTEDGIQVPYLFVGHYLGNLPLKNTEILEYLIKSNLNIYDPIKFGIDVDEVVLVLRSRADKIDPDYIKTLLPVMNIVSDRFIEEATFEFGFVSKAEANSGLKRMVQ